MFQTKLSVFLGAYTLIGFAVGLIHLFKNLDENTDVADLYGPAALAGALWPVHMFALLG